MELPSTTKSEPGRRPIEPESTSFGAWTLVWVLYITKLFTIVFVVLAAHSYQAAILATVTTWFWLGPMVALGAAPLVFKFRLRRVRARKLALLQSEWNVNPAIE